MYLMDARLLWLFLSGLIYISCNTATPVKEPVANLQAGKYFAAQVRDGDLVLRLGNDITSNMLAQLNPEDKRFSHIGICFIENGAKMVYHSLGSEYGAHNYLRKDSLAVFFNLADNLSIGYARANLDAGTRQRIHDTLEQWYQTQIPFDMDFDWKSDDKMYCSEMVAKAIMRGNKALDIPVTDTLGRQYYAIDNILNTLTLDTLAYYSRSLRKR